MSVSNVIRAAMNIRGVKRAELAERLNLTGAAIANKLVRGSFSTDDTIRVAHALNARLAFVDDKGQIIVAFSPEDAAPPRQSGKPKEHTAEKEENETA